MPPWHGVRPRSIHRPACPRGNGRSPFYIWGLSSRGQPANQQRGSWKFQPANSPTRQLVTWQPDECRVPTCNYGVSTRTPQTVVDFQKRPRKNLASGRGRKSVFVIPRKVNFSTLQREKPRYWSNPIMRMKRLREIRGQRSSPQMRMSHWLENPSPRTPAEYFLQPFTALDFLVPHSRDKSDAYSRFRTSGLDIGGHFYSIYYRHEFRGGSSRVKICGFTRLGTLGFSRLHNKSP